MTEGTLTADDEGKGLERFTRGPMKRIVQIRVEGINLYSVGPLPVYEVAIGIAVKGWKCTGTARYRHVTDRSRFRFQVSAKDGTVLSWQAEAGTTMVTSPDKGLRSSLEDDVDPGLLKRTEALLAELVGVGMISA